MNYYVQVLKKYAVFSGRSQRKEFFMFFLFNILVGAIFAIIDITLDTKIGAIITLFYSLAVAIPAIAVTVRRLHDTNRNGWWFFIDLIPVVGAIILLIFVIQDSQPGTNKYGPNPKKINL